MRESGRRSGLLAGLGWLGLAALPGALRAQPAQAAPLQLGLLPITSTRVLLRNYQQVQGYLEQQLGQRVELATAPDFRRFQTQAQAGRYDLVVTAAHLGRLLQQDSGFIPLLRYRAPHRTLLLMARERPVQSLEELRGRTLAGPDPITLAAVEADAWLRARGLRAGTDYTLLDTPTPSSAAHAVLHQQSVLAVSSPQGLKNTPEPLREQLAVFATLPEIPSLLWLAHPRLAAQVPRLRAALLGFTADSEAGRIFYEATGYEGLREVPAGELRAVDAYLPRLRELLKAGR